MFLFYSIPDVPFTETLQNRHHSFYIVELLHRCADHVHQSFSLLFHISLKEGLQAWIKREQVTIEKSSGLRRDRDHFYPTILYQRYNFRIHHSFLPLWYLSGCLLTNARCPLASLYKR